MSDKEMTEVAYDDFISSNTTDCVQSSGLIERIHGTRKYDFLVIRKQIDGEKFYLIEKYKDKYRMRVFENFEKCIEFILNFLKIQIEINQKDEPYFE